MKKGLKEYINEDTVLDIVEEFEAEAENVLRDVRNCVRRGGFKISSKDLAVYLRSIAHNIERTADEIENFPKTDLDESENGSRIDTDFYNFLSETFESYEGSYSFLVQDVRRAEKDWIEGEENEDPNYLANLRRTVRSTGETWLRQEGRELCSEELTKTDLDESENNEIIELKIGDIVDIKKYGKYDDKVKVTEIGKIRGGYFDGRPYVEAYESWGKDHAAFSTTGHNFCFMRSFQGGEWADLDNDTLLDPKYWPYLDSLFGYNRIKETLKKSKVRR